MQPIQESELMITNEIAKMFHDLIRRDEDRDHRNNTCRQLLRHLAHQDGRTQLELAQLVHLTPPSVSIALQKMEGEGLITRAQDQNDLRSTRVFLTDMGREAHCSAFERVRALEERVMSCMSQEEREGLRASLEKMKAQILDLILEETKA